MAGMNREDLEQLEKLTSQLRKQNNEAYHHYIHTVRGDESYEPDFYGQVKPFADSVKEKSDEWKPLALRYVKQYEPDYVYPLQVENTVENLEIISVQSFFPKTGKKRFVEMIKSIDFILEQLEEQVRVTRKGKAH
ncbi:DUF1798 family protein [Halalkalibacterium halodurans]|nr:DUF1798 family protein [Halalkalibacterium halodurans]TPE70840.1 DUF1798 family protein [Halalkalibacterium halodurans]